ncbi:MAG: archease [Candidatus Bathyarchaeota archaeon]|jgi:SHS2 domain-containing protein
MGYSYAEEGPTADLTIDAWGGTLGEAFTNAALAVFNAMTPKEEVQQRETRTFKVDGDDLKSLLFNFLDELIYLHEVELIVFSDFDVEVDLDRLRLRAICRGEVFDSSRHAQGIAIKAVTYHLMRIEEREGDWSIRVVMDT